MLTEAMLRLLAQFALAAYTSMPWLHNLLHYDRMHWLPTGASSYSSITRLQLPVAGTYAITRDSTAHLRSS